jgi:hypothetical protein
VGALPSEWPTIVTEVAPLADIAVFTAAKTAVADLHTVNLSCNFKPSTLPRLSITKSVMDLKGAANPREKGGAQW